MTRKKNYSGTGRLATTWVMGFLFGLMTITFAAHAGPLKPTAEKRVIFTHPPTDIENIAGIVPLGSVYPDAVHLLPVDHMYLGYPNPDNGGADAYPVYAMAEGELVSLFRLSSTGGREPLHDYGMRIRHDRLLSSEYIHIHSLSPRIEAVLADAEGSWIEIGPDIAFLLFGERGAPRPLPLAAGEQVGVTRSYSSSWDVGVTDLRKTAVFAGHGERRYPDFDDVLKLLGIKLPHVRLPGGHDLHAACFIDYLTPALRTVWFEQLVSVPKRCGRIDWDINGRLRGAWFNPAIDEESVAPLRDIEYGVLPIVPDNLRPETHVVIGVSRNHRFAALDPYGNYPQLERAFSIAIDFTPGARINPDPAQVSHRTGRVCYDLSYMEQNGGALFNALVLKMDGPRELQIYFDPTPMSAPRCAAALTDIKIPWTTRYVR